LGAWDAKAVHRGMLRSLGAAPSRWACLNISEQLLAGGRYHLTDVDALADDYDEGPLPDSHRGLAELADRAKLLARVIAKQIPRLRSDGLGRVSKIEASAVAAIAEMETRGMAIDSKSWRHLATQVETERREMAGHLHAFLHSKGATSDLFGGETLNLESHQEVLAALRSIGINLPNLKSTTLSRLRPPLGPWLIRYREASKMSGTYGERFLDHLGSDGRIHATFGQIGASTGRMSCSGPNLQAIPKDSEHRACFRCGDHRRLVVADYATCELRILAHFSRDPVFLDAFERGIDLHSQTASTLFNCPVSKTENSELRHRAKAINFGIVYGMSAQGLGRTVGIDRRDADKLLQQYFMTFPEINGFLRESAAAAMRRGWSETVAGRRLYFDLGAAPEGSPERSRIERVARNMPIQGTSADMTKLALGKLRTALRHLPDTGTTVAVHDEIVVECPRGSADEVKEILSREMVAAGEELLDGVPIEVDVAVGTVWGKPE